MTDTSRRSLALRRGDGSSALRPVPGFIEFNATVDGYVGTTRTALSSVTSVEFAIKVKLDAMGQNNFLVGWDWVTSGTRMRVNTSNSMTIAIGNSIGNVIGNTASNASTLPTEAATRPTWLRGKCTVASALCEYWYSYDTTDVYEQVVWTAFGSVLGVNAASTPLLSISNKLVVGGFGGGNAAINGEVYAFYEFVNGVKTAWFVNTDIPSATETAFQSADSGQLWTLSPAMPASAFHPTSGYGGLRSDFAFDHDLTGLAVDQLLGVIGLTHTSVRVSYQPALIPEHPTLGAFEEAMVVRSTAGFPATNLDGAMLLRNSANDPLLAGGWASVVDADLSGRQWYYYALFVRYDTTSGWFKTDEQSWLNPGQYGYPERLWQNFPNYYRRIDQGIWLSPGYLRRICNAIGYEFDALRTWAATVGDVWDFERLSAKLLPEAGAALGLPAETSNGDRRLRTLVGNLMTLRRKKGTKDAVEGYVAAQTGYPTRAYEGLNLLHRQQHAEWPYSFTAQDGSGVSTADNHPGWQSKWLSASTSGQLSRQTAAAGEGTAVGLLDGSFYLRNTNNTGATSTMTIQYGSYVDLPHTAIPIVEGHSYKFSTLIKASQATVGITATFVWLNSIGGTVGTTSSNSFVTVGTTWVRARTATQVAPAGAQYVQIKLFVATAALPNTTGHLNIAKPIFVDLAWRPEGIPTLATNIPLSSSSAGDIGTYVHQDYYEPPREVKVNVYPNRTNLALNSDFLLDNLPANTWGTFDSPTYGQLPVAYSNYADIIDAEVGDSETSYADMAAGLAPLTGVPPTLTYETGASGGRLVAYKATGPYAFTLMHTFFQATDLGGMSAAVGAYTDVIPSHDDPHLNPLVGTVSTPDPGLLPNEAVFVFKIRSASSDANIIADQSAGGAFNSWYLGRSMLASQTLDMMTAVGGSSSIDLHDVAAVVPTGADEYLALSVSKSGTTQTITPYTSPDGETWTALPSAVDSSPTHRFDASAPLRIGSTGSGVTAHNFNGRIYWIAAYNTLDPAGGAGGTAAPGYISLPITSGNYLSTPTTTPLDITGDLCIVAQVSRASWTAASSRTIVSKWGSSYGGYSFGINNLGQLQMTWSPTSSSTLVTNSTVNLSAFPTGSWLGVAVSFDAVSGADRQTKFWTSTDMMTWTQLGTTITGVSGATSITATTGPLRIGAYNGFDSNCFDGNITHVSVRNGTGAGNTVGGTEVFRFDGLESLPPTISQLEATFTAGTGQTVTVTRSVATPKALILPSIAGLLWKFDAAEYPGAGTSWADPRGRTWTSTAAPAIVLPVGSTKMSMSFEWYETASGLTRINEPPAAPGPNGTPLRTTSPQYELTTTETRYEVVNAQPPPNALYGRLLVSCSNIGPFRLYLSWALIEDAPFPEEYFDGTFNDGDDGDFSFAIGKGYTGANYLSPSVYYQQFRHFCSGVGGSDALSQLMPFLLPFRRPFKVISAATGLYNVPT